MATVSGLVLNASEILNELGRIERHDTTLDAKTPVWLHYNSAGELTTVERRTINPTNNTQPLMGSGE